MTSTLECTNAVISNIIYLCGVSDFVRVFPSIALVKYVLSGCLRREKFFDKTQNLFLHTNRLIDKTIGP